MEKKLTIPTEGEKISLKQGRLNIPNKPIIPFIEGDGIGPDIWKACKYVIDQAVEKAYGGEKKIVWMEVYAGEKAKNQFNQWLPDQTIDAFKEFLVGLKGPLTTPVGGSFRSLNVTLRQKLDLYTCLRPVAHFEGVPSPVTNPQDIDMVIFRENSEDVYAGIEFEKGSDEAKKLIQFLQEQLNVTKIRFPETSGIGIKPISEEGSKRLIKAAIEYAIEHNRDSVTLVHKGNIMKFTEGAFRNWGYDLAKEAFGATDHQGGPWQVIKKNGREIIIKDVIADAFLQQILLRPKEYDVIATMNLNGDYLSDALAAQVGGIGIAPGANINYDTKVGIFEATHGTAPKYANKNVINPSSLILSAEMMLQYLGWKQAGQMVLKGMKETIKQKKVTYDFHRLIPEATLVKTSEFAQIIVSNL